MKVIVDTCVWSLALRRKNTVSHKNHIIELQELISEFRVQMLGSIRQEILSGIKETVQFNKLAAHLRAFPDLASTIEDYELAASYFNRCRKLGLQGSNTDFLICAIAKNHNMSIFTIDKDFSSFSKHLPIKLHLLR